MTTQVLFFARRLIENGVPEISCPNCGYKTRGWLAMKMKKVTHCFNCGNIFRILELKNRRR